MTNKADAKKLGYVGSQPKAGKKRDSNAWFTPDTYLESVHAALGSIDLDPFSSVIANKRVKAKKIFTEKDDAFKQDWKKAKAKTAFMNPPYSAALARDAVMRFVAENGQGYKEGIILVNNATETQWFQLMLREATAVCLTNHRISFWNADGKAISGNTRGQAFFYFGKTPEKFLIEFSKHGTTINLGGTARTGV